MASQYTFLHTTLHRQGSPASLTAADLSCPVGSTTSPTTSTRSSQCFSDNEWVLLGLIFRNFSLD